MLEIILSAALIGISFALFLECRSHSRTRGKLADLTTRDAKGRFVRRERGQSI